MLHTITCITEDLETLIKDDPVRPEIPLTDRVNINSRMYVLKDGDKTEAVTCVKFLNSIPEAVEDMAGIVESATTAVFYTIWSYAAGAGRTLIQEALKCNQDIMETGCGYYSTPLLVEIAKSKGIKLIPNAITCKLLTPRAYFGSVRP